MSSLLKHLSYLKLSTDQLANSLRSFRHHSDFIRYPATEGRTVRVPLSSEKLIGTAISRGTRPYQEDAHAVCNVLVPVNELSYTLKRDFGITWRPEARDSDLASQVLFVGLYDGHGGPKISEYLRDHLHDRLETVDPSRTEQLVDWLKSSGSFHLASLPDVFRSNWQHILGGYFKRYRGGVLEEWLDSTVSGRTLDLEARATLAFLQTDFEAAQMPESKRSGTTASVAFLHPLELPTSPFFSSEYLALTVAHCGDTRIVLCSTESGKAFPMTEDHHADARGEANRLRRLGTGLVTDSYGEARWMGAVANTRGLGDAEFKPYGVTPEPEIRRRILKGKDWAFLAFISDGITSVLSDDEVVDLARSAPDPRAAARAILSFAEEMGSEDNASVLIVPLAGWGTVRGPDSTKERRAYRREQMVGSERQRRM